MEKEVEKEKNTIDMVIWYLEENIYMEKDISEKGRNI